MAIKKATITVDDFMKSVGITKKEANDAAYGVKTRTVSSKTSGGKSYGAEQTEKKAAEAAYKGKVVTLDEMPADVASAFRGEKIDLSGAKQLQPEKSTVSKVLSDPMYYAEKVMSKPLDVVQSGVKDLLGGTKKQEERLAANQQMQAAETPSKGKLAEGILVKGADFAASSVTSTLDWLLGNAMKEIGWENNPISKLNEFTQKNKEANAEYYAKNLEKGTDAQKKIDEYGTMTAAAIPQAVIAMMSAGASAGAHGAGILAKGGTQLAGAEASAAGLAGASAAAKAGQTVKTVATAMAKDPNYWTAFASVAGDSYQKAKEDGASDWEANMYALANGLGNAAIEVGGGIQTLPVELQAGNRGVRAWISSMADEGKEEVVQGVIERALQNLTYGKGNSLLSTKDENAVLNPVTAAKEFAGGAVVGGVLGGGQMLADAAINRRALPGDPTRQLAAAPKTGAETSGLTETAQSPAQEQSQNSDNFADMQQLEAESGYRDSAPSNTNVADAQNSNSKNAAWRGAGYINEIAARIGGTPTWSDVVSASEYLGKPEILEDVTAAIREGYLRTGENGELALTERAKVAEHYDFNPENVPMAETEGERSDYEGFPQGTGAASRGFDPYSNWQNQSDSFHNVGEKAERVVDLPTENLQGQRTMKGGQTVMESANTPLFRASQIADLYLDGRLSFDPKTNQELVDEARGVIEKDGWRKALTDWTVDVRAGKVSDKLTAMGATLLNNAGNAFDVSTKEYMDIVCDYVQLTSNAGHALQANRILKTLTPESRLYAMQRSIYSIAEEAGIEDAQINPELAEKYRNAKNDTERDAVVSEIQQDIAKRMGSTLLDKFNALRYVNMLGNFKTQIRNVTGNVTMAITQKVKNEIAACIETIAHTVSGGKVERTKSFGVAPELYAAAWNDFRSVQKAALGEGKYSDINEISNNEFLRGIDDKRTIFKNNGTWGTEKSDSAFLRSAFMQKVRKGTDALWKAPEAYRKLTNLAMEQGDVIFSRTTYADALAGYLKAHGMNDAEALRNGTVDPVLLDDARMYAIQEAQESTFRDSNPFSDWVSKAGRRSGTPKAVRVMAEGTMPFRKTPANVLVRAEEYSPIGAVNALIKTGQAISKNSDVNANDAINSWAKTLTGSTVFAVGCLLAKAGLLHGADDDDDKQAAFDSLTGHQEYALELPGGTSITLDTFAPTVMPLLMGGALYDISAENGWNLKNIESVVTSLADPMINMSMLSGVNDALDNIKFTDNNLGQLAITSALNYLTQGLTNTLSGQAERTFEPNRMTTYVEKDSGTPEWMQRLLGKASAKTPGWDYHQTEYLDAWGRTQSNGSLAERAFNNFLNPTYTSKISDDKVDVELQRLADSTATTKMFPNGTAPYELEFDDKAKNISQQQRETYQKTYGQTAYSNVKSLINSSQYGKMSDGERAAAINYLYQYATTQAKKKVGADGGETPNWTSKSEGSIAENAAYRAFLDTARAKAVPMSPSTSTETNGAQMQGTLKLNLSDAYKLNVFAQFLGDGAQEHVHEAYSKGYSLQQITDFYQAMNLKDESGKAVYKKDDLIRWATKNGFTYGQAQTMYRIFHPSTK